MGESDQVPARVWTRVKATHGDEWDFQAGPLVATYTGLDTIPVERDRDGGKVMEDQTVYLFETIDGDPVLLWGGYVLDRAFDPDAEQLIRVGDVVRIDDRGTSAIKGGGRQLHRYVVDVAPVGMTLADVVAAEQAGKPAAIPGERLQKAGKGK